MGFLKLSHTTDQRKGIRCDKKWKKCAAVSNAKLQQMARAMFKP
jgi:hypothetical protein